MNKILVEKDTNMISQIINVDDGYVVNVSDYGDNFYLVEDPNNEIDGYNLRFNLEKEIFEVVDGLEAHPVAETLPREIDIMRDELNRLQMMALPSNNEVEALRQENTELKSELEMIKKHLGLS